ncbi:MAG: hypothetical protein OXH92_01480 [Bryobacterales bacterium]|nr:hypothetical protein [Bryobacterales bacterium]MDE0296530.1 hypothetical protein [Bryobacterales bacterium]MDE0432656.1 hypothetical protein [Bryobacterales bacterium]
MQPRSILGRGSGFKLVAEMHDGWIEADRYLDMSLWEEQKRERLRALADVA